MPEETRRAEKIRCPSCGALNGAGASWCGQCLKPFPPPVSPAPPEAPAGAPPTSVGGPQASPAAPEDGLLGPGGRPKARVSPGAESLPPAGTIGIERGAFRVTERGVVWRCSVCDTENPMESTHCSACNAAFSETLRPPEPERVQRDPGMTAIYSMVLPGAGHAYLGLWGQAVARAAIWLWVAFTAFMGAVQRKGGILLAITFGLAAIVLWLVSAHDAYREANGEPKLVILKGRLFLYVVLGLLLLLMVLLVATAIQARGAPGGPAAISLL